MTVRWGSFGRQPPQRADFDFDGDLVEQAMEMSLADFLAPLLEQGEHTERVEVRIDVGYNDGRVRTVKLEASIVEGGRAKMRA